MTLTDRLLYSTMILTMDFVTVWALIDMGSAFSKEGMPLALFAALLLLTIAILANMKALGRIWSPP